MNGPDFQDLLERATAMRRRTHQSMIELNSIRARAELALTHAADAVIRANAALNLATQYMISARAYGPGH